MKWILLAFLSVLSVLDACVSGQQEDLTFFDLVEFTGIALPSDSTIRRSARDNSIVDAAMFFEIEMSKQDAETFKLVLHNYPRPTVKFSFPDELVLHVAEWWKHDIAAERYAIDRPHGNNVYAIYDFVDCADKAMLFVAIFPF